MGLVAPSRWDLSSLARGQNYMPCIARWILSHWTTREVPWMQKYHYKFVGWICFQILLSFYLLTWNQAEVWEENKLNIMVKQIYDTEVLPIIRISLNSYVSAASKHLPLECLDPRGPWGGSVAHWLPLGAPWLLSGSSLPPSPLQAPHLLID